ncbi:DnaD domain protein [Rummeliibacillus sp. TYF-LIM-RU47]|uniref:DnaD domain protein n=1 Tax=Rummeliibacillus sp. TYF-LIM-RU47 TaxID=2608406 RepID=UPI00123B3258|nr:DnaD domain protein [Rummeliibacillus sp. TYF-LIM-RU47]
MNQDTQNILRKSRKQRAFTQVDNEITNNENLSWQAKGLMLYLLSKPDDWKFYETDIVKRAKNGPDSVKSIIKELLEVGYLIRGERIRDEKGHLKGYNYTVEPYLHDSYDGKSYVGKSNVGKPYVGIPYVGESINSNTNYSNTDSLNNINLNNTNNILLSNEETTATTNIHNPGGGFRIDPNFGNLIKVYENNFGLVRSMEQQEINYLYQEYPTELIYEALKMTALKRDVKSPAIYMGKVLRSWKEQNISDLRTLELYRKRSENSATNKQSFGRDDGKESRIKAAHERRAKLLQGESNRTDQPSE